jgi:hypothetical protein
MSGINRREYLISAPASLSFLDIALFQKPEFQARIYRTPPLRYADIAQHFGHLLGPWPGCPGDFPGR